MYRSIIAAAVLSAVLIASQAGSARPLAASGCTDGKNRKVKMVNDSDSDIIRLYGSNIGASNWQEDVLGDDTLDAGATVTVNWDDGTCYCNFDFKAVYANGKTSIENGQNVCKISSIRFAG